MIDNHDNATPLTQNSSQPGTWKEAFLSGVPHLFIAFLLLIFTILPYITEGSSSLKAFEIATLVFAWSMIGVLILMFIIAWRQGWPRWSASTFFYIFLALASPIFILYQGREYMILYFLFTILLVVWVYSVTVRNVIKGLLVITPIAVLSWFPVLEFIPDAIRNPLQLGMLLITACAAILIARLGDWRRGIWIIIGCCMLAGFPISYFRTFHHNIPPEHTAPGTVAEFLGRYAQALFWSSMLVIAPLLIWFLGELSKKCGREGKLGYRLSFWGLLLNLISSLASHVWYSRFARISPEHLIEYFFSILIFLSAAIFIFGILKLLRAARMAGLIQGPKAFVLFFAAIGFLLMFMYPVFDSPMFIPTNLPIGLFFENSIPDIFVYSMGIMWLFLGGWLISRSEVVKQARKL
jgi:hypothetical protein